MFRPPLAAASLSGQSDAAWARQAAPYVGCAFLGGIALDEATRSAARDLRARDREEFLPSDPIAFIDDQLAMLDTVGVLPGFNVRSGTTEPIAEAAAVCTDHDALIEINAHCRQTEMCAAGAGESLLEDGERLCEQVAVADAAGSTVSVKVRTEVDGVDLSTLSRRLVDAGADVLHVDAMDSESVIRAVAEAAPEPFLIANNGVRDRQTAVEYLEYGADAVSVGRPSDDPVVLQRVREAVEAWHPETRSGTPDPEVSPDA
jgi:TIM-barrel protein